MSRCRALLPQLDLFENIKPVFVNKPLLIVANKIDARPMEEVPVPLQERIQRIVSDNKATLMLMSNFTEEGVMNVKKTACDQLLAQRVERKHRSNKVCDAMLQGCGAEHTPPPPSPSRRPLTRSSSLAQSQTG